MKVALSAMALVLAAALPACTREVAAGLDESEANRGVVVLARAGVEAEKSPDPSADGKFRLVVERDDATTAISVLSGEELPRPRPAAPHDSSFVASPEADRAARIVATAAQIERTLSSIDGVLDARVLLDVPTVDALATALAPAGAAPARPTASVLLRHRGPTPPVSIDDVRRLTAGAVSGLDAQDVAVVFIAVAAPPTAADRQTAYFGPVAVSRSTIPTARAIAIGVFAVIALLVATILVLAMRLRRHKEAADSAAVGTPAKA